MRIDQLLGYWVRYKDSGSPVEVFDRVVYSFKNARREALVSNAKHLAFLMETRRYEVVGVEVEDPPVESGPPAEDSPQKTQKSPRRNTMSSRRT